ncbi:MAG TPA: rod shape-determining protein MreD [Methylophilaceae bacterium]|nr:rod shape-determining protein MreD [Methylophilaceae bacterium]HAJ70625.1 rod shape-determining protein MreD [Methylophilaceae bacterium]
MRHVELTTVITTLAIALIFQLYPWSGYGITLRPDFLLVVTMYWILRAPNMCNVGVAWLAGLIVDLSTGSLLGQHALGYAFTAFLGLLYQRRLVLFNKWQLSAYVLTLLTTERFIVLILKLFADNEAPHMSYFLPILTNLILWQIMVMIFGAPTRPKHK